MRAPAAAALLAITTCACFVAGAAGAPVVLPQQGGTVDLLSQANLQLDGAVAADRAGTSIAGAGDVNGDGVDDIIVGAPEANRDGRGDAGVVHVVFGRATRGTIDLGALGTGGFTIVGAAQNDELGSAVAGAGDVNGDGRDDVLIGAPNADNNGRANSGSAYVVFGRMATTTIDLTSLGDAGFRIDGVIPGENAGQAVAGAGDVNGDGRPDLLVGAPEASNELGAAYVVFGKASTTPVDLANLGTGGFAILGAVPDDEAGTAVAGAGDMNGDGRADVLVGAPVADNNGRNDSGSAYVVFGKASGTTVNLATLNTSGFRIDGAAANDLAGLALAGAGDVNGDGRPEALVGAPHADNNGRNASGSAYVVFGKPSTTTVDLAALGASGFRIDGAGTDDNAGESVAGVGDMNGDGRSDVIVGGPDASNNGRTASGAAYVVFGRTTLIGVDLASLAAGGVRIEGAATSDIAGVSVASAGDLNGEGRPDALVGAPNADNNGRKQSGSAYVVYGFGEPRLAYAPLQAQVGRTIEEQRPSQLARTGTPSFRVSPPLPAGLRLEGLGVISGTPTEAQPRTTHRVTMTDLAGEVTAELVVTVTPPPDTTPPRLTVQALSPQPASKRGDVRVRATCNEPCALRASGQVVIAGGSKLKLAAARATLTRAGGKTLVLRLTVAGTRRLAAASAEEVRARAAISVRAIDGAGNAVTKTTNLRVR
jgi:hypothetical protein